MPRYRCVLMPDVNDSELVAMLPQRAMRAGMTAGPAFEIAYEFNAPDMASVEQWLLDRAIPPSSVTALEELPAEG
ncbi:hypothetical protein CMK11_21450 [Candidatus Poribacteria bacterium]|nr:hypothetical protein [Candidatus Poribacteria bacterium]